MCQVITAIHAAHELWDEFWKTSSIATTTRYVSPMEYCVH